MWVVDASMACFGCMDSDMSVILAAYRSYIWRVTKFYMNE